MFKYLGTTLTYQKSIQDDNKRILKSGNSCYHLGQNGLSSSSLSKNLKMIYRTIILPVVMYECEHRLRVFENRLLRRIFGPRRYGVTRK